MTTKIRLRSVMQQTVFFANQSLPIVGFCLMFASMVTVMESSFHMKLVIQNDEMVPGFASILILRELGTMLAALLITSRVGAGMAAEIGTMNVTEQIDALKMLGIDPIRFLVVPRFLAGLIGGGMVSIVASLVCLFSAALVSVFVLGSSFGAFLTAMHRFVQFQDLVFATIKGVIFGGTIPLVACYYGFHCETGAEGVGKATTQSVVISSVLLISADFVLTAIFANFY